MQSGTNRATARAVSLLPDMTRPATKAAYEQTIAPPLTRSQSQEVMPRTLRRVAPRLSCADPRRSGRVAEGGALLRRYGGEYLHRGFESLLLRFAHGEVSEWPKERDWKSRTC